jgi:spore maturation protein A
MLQAVFAALMGSALLWGLMRGEGAAAAMAMLEAAREALNTALSLAGAFGLFCGMLAMLRQSGAVGWLSGRVRPFLRLLLGKGLTEEALESVTLNLTANMLGLGSAATPLGLEAARKMGGSGEAASNALCLFLVINASSVQLLPTTVIALRAAEGSAAPGSVIFPALLATAISTLTGIIACKIGERLA